MMANLAGTHEAESRLHAELLAMINGYRATAVLHVATRLGVPDLLGDGTKDADELTTATNAHGLSLSRLLRGLAVLGIVDEVAPSRFALTSLGAGLRRDAPHSLRREALRSGDEMGMRLWGNLMHSVMTGETAFDRVFGMGSFDYLARDPARSAAFNRAMVASTTEEAPALLAAYDFSRFGKIVDVGGGSGAFIALILQASPGSRGILFDTKAGTEGASALLEQAGVADRCDVVQGDFFTDELPAGGDTYVLKSVIDDWDDVRARALLENCRRAIAPRGRLVVIAPVVPARVEPSERDRGTVMFDLWMLVSSGGRERTETEFAELLAVAGFRLAAAIPTEASFPYHIIEAVPV